MSNQRTIMAGLSLMKKMNPVERKLFMDFLRKFHPEQYELLRHIPTSDWNNFKILYAASLFRYWRAFNKWIENLGWKPPHERIKNAALEG